MEGRTNVNGDTVAAPGRPFWWSLASSAGLHASLFACALLVAWGAAGTGERSELGSRIVFAAAPETEPTPPIAVEPERRIEAPEPDAAPLVTIEDPPDAPILAEPEPAVHLLEPRHLPARISHEPIARIRALEPPPIAEAVPTEPPPATVAPLGSPPRLLSGTPPAYPRECVGRGEEGTVVLRLAISAQGGLDSVEVVESSGHPRLDRAAREALLAWRFEPATLAGEPTATSLLHPVTFRLNGAR